MLGEEESTPFMLLACPLLSCSSAMVCKVEVRSNLTNLSGVVFALLLPAWLRLLLAEVLL